MLHLTFIWAVLLYLNTTVLPTSVMVAASILYGCWAVAGLVAGIVKSGHVLIRADASATRSSSCWFPFAAHILTLVYAFSVGWYVPVLLIILMSLLILASLICIVALTVSECQED